MREPRSQTLTRGALAALRGTGLTLGEYAANVVELYHQRVALHERTVKFHSGGDPYDTRRANEQIVTRYMNAQVRFAADLEEAWVLALPNPYRQHLLAELADRYGLIAAAAPATCGPDQQCQVGKLCKETGEAMVKVGELLDDGVIDQRDRPAAMAALREIDDVIAAATSLKATIEHATQVTPLRRRAG